MKNHLRIAAFTLLEMMLAIALLAIAASAIGIRIGKGLEERRYQTSVERLFLEMESCRRLALNMQADWTLVISKGNQIQVLRTCYETGISSQTSWEAPFTLYWNQQPIEKIAIQFSSSGAIAPEGVLELVDRNRRVQWILPDIFSQTNVVLPRPDTKAFDGEIKS